MAAEVVRRAVSGVAEAPGRVEEDATEHEPLDVRSGLRQSIDEARQNGTHVFDFNGVRSHGELL